MDLRLAITRCIRLRRTGSSMGSRRDHMLMNDAGTQVYASGPQELTYVSDVDDSEQSYRLYVPPAFDPSTPYSLVPSLHGAGSNHHVHVRRVFGKGEHPGESMAQASRSFPPLPAGNYLVASG